MDDFQASLDWFRGDDEDNVEVNVRREKKTEGDLEGSQSVYFVLGGWVELRRLR